MLVTEVRPEGALFLVEELLCISDNIVAHNLYHLLNMREARSWQNNSYLDANIKRKYNLGKHLGTIPAVLCQTH